MGSSFEVTSNGKTVWINGPTGCLARICRLSAEVFHPDGKIETLGPDFDFFEHRFHEVHGIDLRGERQNLYRSFAALAKRQGLLGLENF